MNTARGKIKIVHVINELVFAGAEILVVNLSIAQAKSGCLVSIISLGKVLPEIRAKLYDFNIRCVSLGVNGSGIGGIYRLLKLFKIITPDIVHVHLFPAQYLVALLKIFGFIKIDVCVTTEHSTHNRRRSYKFFKWFERFVYKAYDKVFLVSDAAFDAFVKWLPEFRNNARVLNNAIDLAKGRIKLDYKAEYGISGPVILCVARLYPVKGLDIAIRSLRYIPEFTLFILGDGPSKKNLIELAKELDVASNVIFIEPRQDVYKFMKGCDVYIQPSRWEGFGLAALEAVASGSKVICSNVPGMRDYLLPLGASLFEPENDMALASTIVKVHASCKIAVPSDHINEYGILRMEKKYFNEYLELAK